MDLKSVFSSVTKTISGESEQAASYLAVKISSSLVVAASWTISGGKVVVGEVGKGEIKETSWEGLLSACDEAVSAASLGKFAETEAIRTIFGVPFDWVSDGKVLPEHASTLRKICKELELTPLGFVVLTEALENYFKEVEGAPLTAILVGAEKKEKGGVLFLSMYRAGKDLGTVPFKFDSFTPEDICVGIEKALGRFSEAEIFPSRIILYDGAAQLAEISSKMNAYQWTKRLPFLHFPKVEVVPADFVVRAVALASGMQLGGKIEAEEENVLVEEVAEEETFGAAELKEVSLAEAGFVTEEEGTAPKAAAAEGEIFGKLKEIEVKTEAIVAQKLKEPWVGKLTRIVAGGSRALGAPIKGVWQEFRGMSFKLPTGGGRYVSLGILAVLLLAAGIVVFVPSARVIVGVRAVSFGREATVAVVTDASSKEATSGAIIGSFIEVSEVGTKRGVASGKKLVGEKAKGTVTMYSAASAKTFAEGTAIASLEGLKFSLDREVTVASASDFLSPATVTVTVTAMDIGDKYNLPVNSRFSVGGLSTQSYLAKNDSAFSGGSSHEAVVVTKEDQDRLVATLSAELTEKANSDIAAQLSGRTLLPNALVATVSKKRFSKDVDSEAETLSLDLTMDFKGIVFAQSDLVALFAQKFAADIPSQYALRAEEAVVEVKSAKVNKDGSVVISVGVREAMRPQIDLGALTAELAGKSPGAAQEKVLKLSGVASFSLESRPRFLEIVGRFILPIRKENIKVEVVSL